MYQGDLPDSDAGFSRRRLLITLGGILTRSQTLNSTGQTIAEVFNFYSNVFQLENLFSSIFGLISVRSCLKTIDPVSPVSPVSHVSPVSPVSPVPVAHPPAPGSCLIST